METGVTVAVLAVVEAGLLEIGPDPPAWAVTIDASSDC